MVTELFESYDQFQSKQSFSIGVSFGAFGANNALSNPFLAATVACGVVGGQFGANTGIFVSVTPLHGSLGCAPCGPLHVPVLFLC